ncbi:gasdermin-A2-like isoform X2 [Malaclemys terrapin pileata]|uniref:gasdermin-A2-like isoform X2 n=1 Tax=Malaclemys terrapin pileata TaxID=2991368 RepID=UPI0023A79601|nr:gasdermin-A2-like isoform X2 [Malaclemys terrapin pileata]
MFARAAKQLTKELDSDRRFIPISSLASADSYRPFSLVMKKQSRLPWPPRKYLATSYKLTDVFKEGTAMDAEVKYDAPLRYSETTDQKVGVKISLKLQPTAVDSGGSWKSSFSVSQITVRKAYMVKKGQWKIDTSHKFIKRFSGSHRIKLYVVTEAFEIKEPLLIEERSQGGGKVMITAGEIGEIQGQGESIKKKTMEIPQGTVVAYVVQPLDIQEEIFLRASAPSFVFDVFQKVKDTIKGECEPLMSLSQDFRIKLLGTLKSFLQDGDVISDVKTVLELFLAGGQPKHSMLDLLDEILRPQVENLLHDLGVFCEDQREESPSLLQPVHLLCSSLEDLDFRVLPLLVTCIEKNMVAKQLALMDGIMEWILSSDKERIFSLASSLPEEEKNITAEMMNTCGLIPQTDTPSLTYLWNKEAQSNLTALYAALYALWILSE